MDRSYPSARLAAFDVSDPLIRTRRPIPGWCNWSPDSKKIAYTDKAVVPVANETGLRNLAWIEDNRRKVEQMTGGLIGYVYLPNTSIGVIRISTATFSARLEKRE